MCPDPSLGKLCGIASMRCRPAISIDLPCDTQLHFSEVCQLLAAPIYFREDMGIEEPADGVNFHCGK
ncbi:hypothetical protein STEG23_033255, partial [Scotinomys teguina]